MNGNIIGGEFDFLQISKNCKRSDFFDGCVAYSSGRAAFYQILKMLASGIEKTVFLPDYLCDSIYHICDVLGLPYQFYPVTDKLRVDIPVLKANINATGGGIVLIINYYGVIDVERDIRDIKTECSSVSVILDNVQAPFAMSHDSVADVSFTSLRKAFPLPDGGLAYSKYYRLPHVSGANCFSQYKIAASYLKHLSREDYYDDAIYLNMFSKGESIIGEDLNHTASAYTMEAFPMLNIEQYASLRRRNAAHIVRGLANLGLMPCVDINLETQVPLFVPVMFDGCRDEIRKEMFRHQIFCPVHWPVTGHHDSLKRGQRMANNELSIIIDQRYSIADMDRMLNIISDNYRCK